MFGLLAASDLIGQLQSAIDVGELASQQAPGGHPIYPALDSAREVLAWLQENESLMASGVGSQVQAKAQAAIDDVYSALALIRNDPDAPLPRTIFPALSAPGGLSWTWIAGGAALVLGVAILFQKGKRKR